MPAAARKPFRPPPIKHQPQPIKVVPKRIARKK
jgi:hypothetical protein